MDLDSKPTSLFHPPPSRHQGPAELPRLLREPPPQNFFHEDASEDMPLEDLMNPARILLDELDLDFVAGIDMDLSITWNTLCEFLATRGWMPTVRSVKQALSQIKEEVGDLTVLDPVSRFRAVRDSIRWMKLKAKMGL